MTILKRCLPAVKPRFWRWGLIFALSVASLGEFAWAHQGPPFPIVVDKKTGPCVISVWTDPDIGIGTFFVIVDPLPGSKVPDDLKVDLAVTPVSGRLPEVVYATTRDSQRGQVQFNAQVNFDRQEFWKVRVHLSSSVGEGEVISQVEATPPGLGRWDLLFYLLPFLAVVGLFLRGMRKSRKRRAARLQQPASSQ
jgi:hypothetical protein